MAVTNPKKSTQTSYRGNTYNFLYEFVDEGGSDIDLSSDYSDITYRVFAPNSKSSPYASLSVGGGGLSITNTNELSGELSASETDGLPNVAFYELEFELNDGSTEVYLFGRHIAEDYDSSSGEVSVEATVQINQTTNQVVFAESYDAAAKAVQAKNEIVSKIDLDTINQDEFLAGNSSSKYVPKTASEVRTIISVYSKTEIEDITGFDPDPITADYYVSQSATNGYASGSDTNNGTSASTPFLTVEKAYDTASNGDVIAINDGIYDDDASFHFVSDKNLTFKAENTGSVTLTSPDTSRVFLARASSQDTTMVFEGIVFDAEGDTNMAFEAGISSSTNLLDLTFTDCTFKDFTETGLEINSQPNCNLQVTSCSAESTSLPVFAGISWVNADEGVVRVNGFDMDILSTRENPKFGVYILADKPFVDFECTGVTGTLDTNSSVGVASGIRLINVSNGYIYDNDFTVSSTNTSGSGIRVSSDSSTIDANDAKITGNTINCNTQSGYAILVGDDASTSGDNNHNFGFIEDNNVSSNTDTTVHGIMIGYGRGGTIQDNIIDGCGIGTIAKVQDGGIFRRNTIKSAGSQFIRSKGATDTEWESNSLYMDEANASCDMILIDAEGATDSTGITIDGNSVHVYFTPAKIVEVASGSTATFTNNLYNIQASLNAGSWDYQGTTYDTLSAWKTGQESTARP